MAECYTIEPSLTDELQKAGVTIICVQGDKENIYYYDYSNSLNQIIKHGAREFHKHYYSCEVPADMLYYGIVSYDDSSEKCYRIQKDFSWMISKVKNNAKYDIKVRDRWNDLFSITENDIYFYGSQFEFSFDGNVINAEKFGNILFGAITNAGGFNLDTVKAGGSLYSLLKGHELDSKKDSDSIEYGYQYFNQYKGQYSYIHVQEEQD